MRARWSDMVDPRSSFCKSAILAWALATTAWGQPAFAESYKTIKKAIMDPRQVSQLRRQVSAIVRVGGALSDTDRALLRKYYLFHIVAGMTRPEALNNPQRFPTWRKAVVGDLGTMSRSRPKHDFVRDLVYNSAGRLVQDRGYSPACRYNALLLIGELNNREAAGAGRSVTPAVPYAPARKYLLKVSASDDAEEIKVGALIGLARHARLAAAAGARPDPNLVRTFEGVLQQKEPKAGQSQDGLHWMQRIAVDALGDIGQPGATLILEPVVSDRAVPMSLRCAAADAIGRLDYRNAANINNQPALLKGLGQLATATLTRQIQQLQQYIVDNPPDRFAVGRIGDEDVQPPEDPFVRRVRRQLKHELLCVGRGLTFVDQVSADRTIKNAITSLLSNIKAVMRGLDNKNMSPQDLFDNIGPPAMQLEAVVKNI